VVFFFFAMLTNPWTNLGIACNMGVREREGQRGREGKEGRDGSKRISVRPRRVPGDDNDSSATITTPTPTPTPTPTTTGLLSITAQEDIEGALSSITGGHQGTNRPNARYL
jgi:hypothetical protein